MKRLLTAAFGKKRHRLLLVLTVVSMCLATIGTQMEAMALALIANKGASQTLWFGDALNRLIPVEGNWSYFVFFIMFVALFNASAMFAHRFATKVLAIRISRDLREEYFLHIQSLPMSFYQQYKTGSLSSRVLGDAHNIAEATNACLINYFQTPFTVLTALILCIVTSWKLSLLVFLGMPLIVGVIVFISGRVKRVARQIQKNQELFSSVLIDFLSGIQTVKLFGMEEHTFKKYREQNDRLAKLEQKSARYDLSSRPIVHTIGMFFLAVALLAGLHLFDMSIGEVLFFAVLLYTFYEPIKKFAEQNSQIQRGVAAAERMHEVLDIKAQIVDETGSGELTSFEGPIEFDDVWFRYGDEWVLKGLSFTVNKGETVAIVGPTGAGKSTIVQLLPRLYEPQKGDIRINGLSIKRYTQKSLREKIAFVPQKPFLFVDTIAENISFGFPFTADEVQAAARQAHAEEFICRLPDRYETELAETGKNLSGGQQQRLAIARALVKSAPILIMDEATSALDSISEGHIKSAIRMLHGKVTQIIIAHRLTTIEDADRIIYLENGCKVGEGTKDELLKTCPGFRRAWEAKALVSEDHVTQK